MYKKSSISSSNEKRVLLYAFLVFQIALYIGTSHVLSVNSQHLNRVNSRLSMEITGVDTAVK